MKLRHALFASVLLAAISPFVQAQAGLQSLQTIRTSGQSVRINNCDVLQPASNPNAAASEHCGTAALIATFDEQVSGSPVSFSVVVSGCGLLGDCDTLDTNTTGTSSLRKPSVAAAYSYFTVSATWSGGSNVSVAVGTTLFPTTTNMQPAGIMTPIVAFQQNVTASAVALASNSVHGFCVKALPTNTITAYVGPSGVTTSTGYPLSPGDWICYQGSNTNLAYVIAISGSGAQVAASGN